MITLIVNNCDIDTIVLSYIYSQPYEGKPNADVAQHEIQFDTPALRRCWTSCCFRKMWFVHSWWMLVMTSCVTALFMSETNSVMILLFIDLPGPGEKISPTMVLETQGGVKRTVHVSQLRSTIFGMIFHVMTLCIGSVKRNHCWIICFKIIYLWMLSHFKSWLCKAFSNKCSCVFVEMCLWDS